MNGFRKKTPMDKEQILEAIKDGSFCAVLDHTWLITRSATGVEKRSCRYCGKNEILKVSKEWIETDA